MTDTMKAMVLTGHGDMDKLEWHEDWPIPKPRDGEVLIKVNACGLNNTDVNTRTAWYSRQVIESTIGEAYDAVDEGDAAWGGASVTFPRIQGADVAGEVVAVGEGGKRELPGKRVLIDPWLRNWQQPMDLDQCGYYGSEADGGFAEYTKVDANNVHIVESALSNEELATFATAYVTAENMLRRANVDQSDTVLIPGASGGVGSALVQLANRRGATTIAMTSDAKREQVAELGPDAILNRAPDNLAAALQTVIGRSKVSVVADIVGGSYWRQLIGVLQRDGRYTCSGAIAGPMVEMDLRTFYLNDLTFTGATIVPPGIFANVVKYIERGEIRPLLARAWPLRELHTAQEAFIAKQHLGNIVVTNQDNQ